MTSDSNTRNGRGKRSVSQASFIIGGVGALLVASLLLAGNAVAQTAPFPPAETFGSSGPGEPPYKKPAPQRPSVEYGIETPMAPEFGLGPVDVAALLAEDDQHRAIDKTLRYGVGRPLGVDFTAFEKYEDTTHNVTLWTADISAEGAMGIRLHFADVSMPLGAQLFVYALNQPDRLAGPYEGKGIMGSGEVLTPTLFGSRLRVEYVAPLGKPEADPAAAPFRIDKLQHVYRDPIYGEDGIAGPGCPDVTCQSAWANTARACAGIGTTNSDSLFCSGQLLDTVNHDNTPYFLTANHCLSTNAVAQNSEIYWFYQTTTCNGTVPSLASCPQSAPCTLVSTGSTSDYTLLMVEGVLPASPFFAGWTSATVSNGTAAAGIHHPNGTYKKISFGAKSTAASCGAGGGHVGVTWSTAGTEPGSSGSGIFRTDNQQLFGQLHCGPSSCSSVTNDDYGSFAVTYPNISTALAAGSDDALEPNDTCAVAHVTTVGAYSSLVVKNTAEDWYRITIASGATLTLNLTFTNAQGDIDMQLYNSCGGSVVASDTGHANNAALSYTNSGASADFLLRVYLFNDTRANYSMAVSFNGSGGNNDTCANATPVGNGASPFSTVGATTDGPNEPTTCNFSGFTQVNNDIWYRYTAPCSGTVTVNVCDATYDSKIAVYGSTCPSSASATACNDDSCGTSNLRSQLTFSATAGSQYLIRVGGYQTATGTGTLTISQASSPPSITVQPSDQAACSGGSATFSVTATGATGYQWRKGGVNIGGATGSSLTINPVVGGSAGSYDVVVSNACGSVTSSAATLTVNTVPSITVQPTNQTACSGSFATFSVTATGATGYQWRKGGVNIGGATSSSLTINPVVGGSAGSYDVVVSNSCGSVTSSAASLTVNTVPSITVQPTNQTACSGSFATFSVTATGATGYQWRKGGVSIGGATSSSLTINPVAGGSAGSYDVVVSNSCGSVTSSAATLTVNTVPSITVNPANQSACDSGSATFSVTATGATGYQWRKGGVNIGGATGSSLTINPVVGGSAGSYDVVVSNSCGSVTSSAASLTVNTVPSISVNPANQSACDSGSATFSVTATGATGYQWRKGGVNIGGAISSSFTINPVVGGSAGSYDVVVSNSCGSVTSSEATLTVDTVPSITVNPANQSACDSGSATFSVTATGATGYQWRKGGVNIGGATGSSLTINPVAGGSAGSYDVVVGNSCGSVTSSAATLAVNTGVSISVHPQSAAVCDGDPASFSVTAGGSGPLTYQWRRNSVDIPSATGSALALSPVSSGDAGSYDCVITGPCGAVTSNAATLSVDTDPSISASPTSLSVCSGQPAGFTVTATGTPSPAYQWRRNGVNLTDGGPISGATGPALSITPTSLATVGSYDVVVSNVCGSATSTAAVLAVTLTADANCDGLVNNFDIDAFIFGLLNGRTAWEAVYTCDYFCANDANHDTFVNNFDIDVFVECLLHGCP